MQWIPGHFPIAALVHDPRIRKPKRVMAVMVPRSGHQNLVAEQLPDPESLAVGKCHLGRLALHDIDPITHRCLETLKPAIKEQDTRDELVS